MIRILFFIVDLGGGGAEKVLVNLVNNLSPSKYDITIRTLFDKGVNRKLLKSHVHYKPCFPFSPLKGFTHILKLFSPSTLYRLFIKKSYDIEIAFMHHTPTRILAGGSSDIPKYAWVHTKSVSPKIYRSERELIECYKKYNGVAFVSEDAQTTFKTDFNLHLINDRVIHNVVDSDEIKRVASEQIDLNLIPNTIKLCSVGRLSPEKGYDRLINILGKLKEEDYNNWHLYLLGTGSEEQKIKDLCQKRGILDKVTLLGYQNNPHKFVSKMDLFVCSSYTEGYSTAVTESIIVGTPILTTKCSGMQEILGDSGAGIITENSEEGLHEGLKILLANPDKIQAMSICAKERSKVFSASQSIKEFEQFIGTLDNA